jgi:hypothetical protein
VLYSGNRRQGAQGADVREEYGSKNAFSYGAVWLALHPVLLTMLSTIFTPALWKVQLPHISAFWQLLVLSDSYGFSDV